jgi:formylmethanofuran dehydrogenase subunit E
VCIGEGDTELLAYDNAEQVKWAEIYQGISDAVDALFELREYGYYFVQPKAVASDWKCKHCGNGGRTVKQGKTVCFGCGREA